MTFPEPLTVRGPEDILGFIPHSLGYWPAASLVAMTLQGTRLGATLRMDLPGPDVLAEPIGFARTVRSYLRADCQANGSLLALFTSNGPVAAYAGYDLLLAGLASVLGEAGMPVRDAWFVGEDFWRDAFCRDPACCPLPGRPVQEIKDSTVNAEMVYLGSSVGPGPEDLSGSDGPVSSLYQCAVLEAEAEWSARLEPLRGSLAQCGAVLAAWETLLSAGPGKPLPPDADRDGFLRASLLVLPWRDAVLVMAAAGRRAALAGAESFGLFDDACTGQPAVVCPPALGSGAAAVAGGPGRTPPHPPSEDQPGPGRAPVPSDLADPDDVPGYGDILVGVRPPAPDWERLNALDLVFEQLALSGGLSGAAALTGRGWIAWCRGRGSYAAAYLGRALGIAPGYRLAGLLLEMVRRGTLCGWAARKEAAWQKFGPDAA